MSVLALALAAAGCGGGSKQTFADYELKYAAAISTMGQWPTRIANATRVNGAGGGSVVCAEAMKDVVQPEAVIRNVPDATLRPLSRSFVDVTNRQLRACVAGKVDAATFATEQANQYLNEISARIAKMTAELPANTTAPTTQAPPTTCVVLSPGDSQCG